MNTIIDNSKSKRPIPTTTQRDFQAWNYEAGKVEEFIEEMEALIVAKETNPEYQKVLKDSKDRIISIAIRAMEIDPKDSHALAEVRGQFNERLFLTKELANVKETTERKKTYLSAMRAKISCWIEANMKGSK